MAGKVLQLATGAGIGLLLPLGLSLHDVGVFFFVQAIISVSIVLAQLGLPVTIPGIVSHAMAVGDTGRARTVAIETIKISIISGLTVGCLVGICAFAFGPAANPLSPQIWNLVPLIIPMIAAGALLGVLAEIHRALYGMVAASFLPALQGLIVSAYLVFALAFKVPLSISHLLTASVLAAIAGIVLGLVQLEQTMRAWQRVPITPAPPSDILAESWPNLVTAMSFVAASQLDIWVVGLGGHPADVACYGLALRIGGLFAVPLTIVSLTILPHIVTNWACHRRLYLQWLLTLSATGATFAALVGFIPFAGFGRSLILTIWGEAYSQTFGAALILGLGQVMFSAGGVAGYVLILLGRQKVAMVSTLIIASVTVLLAVWAMFNFGILGVAAVYAASSTVQALVNVLLVRKFFGLIANARLINPLRVGRLLSHTPKSLRSTLPE
ncbi:lipopolysaccharide biosynthesis protein [Bradyrhizobium sp. 956_D2_N1_5]|uniref:lipopolysaccharide biosynthesis protein n=1 Tax=unclassified Bradyrhizobium TaxID=2631580 RepID=UPI003F209A64